MKNLARQFGAILLLFWLTSCHQDQHDHKHQSSQTNPTKSPIKARQDLMHRWGKAHRHLQTAIKNPAQFDFDALQVYIAMIDNSQTQMWAYFDDNTPHNKVNELIHANPADYQAYIKRFTLTFDKLKSTTHTTSHLDELKTAIEQVNQECKACHQRYKKRN